MAKKRKLRWGWGRKPDETVSVAELDNLMVDITLGGKHYLYASFYDLLRTQRLIGKIEIFPKTQLGSSHIEGVIEQRR